MINFTSNRENFYNDTIRFIVKEKLGKLKRHNIEIKDVRIKHILNPQKEHELNLHIKDFHAKAKHKNFETAFIHCVDEIDRQFK